MNNRGFAITGIIYTLFILFLIVLLSALTGFSVSQRLLVNSRDKLQEKLETVKEINDVNELASMDSRGVADYYGKYVFRVNNTERYCNIYMSSGTSFKESSSEVFFANDNCSSGFLDKTLVKVYVFEEWS